MLDGILVGIFAGLPSVVVYGFCLNLVYMIWYKYYRGLCYIVIYFLNKSLLFCYFTNSD